LLKIARINALNKISRRCALNPDEPEKSPSRWRYPDDGGNDSPTGGRAVTREIAPDELGRLYREHGPALRLFARQWGPEAEDLVHEAFLTLARQRRCPDPVLPWLYRVVRHRTIEMTRATLRRRRREAIAAPAEPWFVPAESKLDADELAAMLAELPLAWREVIVARIWGGLTFEQIARLVGCSLTSAYRRYHDGLAELKERVEGPCRRNPMTPNAS
jgi:RNA polymerase sigma factor (sigma-70 family)